MTNSVAILGGDDEESIAEIKKEAPEVFATGDRAVTRADFNALLINYPGVATANAWGENEEDEPDYDMFNKVNICLLMQNWAHPSTTTKALISSYLYTYSMITVKYEYITAVILDVIIVIDITVVKGYSLSQTQVDVETALEADFVLGVTTDLGEDKQYSNLVRIADALSSVAWHHMTLEIRKELTSGYDSIHEFGATLGATPILPSSVRVFVGDDEVGIDDGAGGFTAIESYYVLDGAIDYDTGVCTINFDPDVPAGATVYVRYQQDSEGDIETSERQVCRLYDINVTSISLET